MTSTMKSAIFFNPQIPEKLLARISKQSGDAIDLSKLRLDKIPLQVIRDYCDTTTLVLDISWNNISSVSPEFSLNLIYLTKLNLSNNYIKTLSENFGLLTDLVYLDLSNNQLETLPVSMGKMTHLCSLYISGNLLRPPLKRFLDDTGINALTRAKQVVKFLDNLANAVSPSPEVPRGVSPLGIRTLSKIHYSSGSSMHLTGGDAGPGTGTPSASSCTSEDQNKTDDEGNHSQTRSILFSSLFILAIWMSLFPLLLAYFVETSYVDWLAIEYPSFQNVLMWYKPYHEVAALMIDWIPRSDSFILKGPRPVVVQNLGIFSSMWMKFRNLTF